MIDATRMNKRLPMLVDAVLAEDARKRFDMAQYGYTPEGTPCGTAACIGGIAHTIFGGEDDAEKYDNLSVYIAALLGVRVYVADELCMFCWDTEDIKAMQITAKEATTAIKNVLKCNNPNWKDVLGHGRYIEGYANDIAVLEELDAS